MFIAHQRDSEVFIKFSNYTQRPYISTFTIVGDGKWLLGINLVKRSKACEKIAETSFFYPKLAFFFILTYYVIGYL